MIAVGFVFSLDIIGLLAVVPVLTTVIIAVVDAIVVGLGASAEEELREEAKGHENRVDADHSTRHQEKTSFREIRTLR